MFKAKSIITFILIDSSHYLKLFKKYKVNMLQQGRTKFAHKILYLIFSAYFSIFCESKGVLSQAHDTTAELLTSFRS